MEQVRITLNAKLLGKALKQVSASRSNIDTVPIGSVCFKVLKDHIELVATDGNRLALRRLHSADNPAEIVGDKYLISNPEELAKYLLSGHSDYVEVLMDGKIIAFCNVGFTEMFRPVQYFGTYPKYEGILSGYSETGENLPQPQQEVFKIGVNRKFLETALKNMTKSKSEIIELKFTAPLSPVYVRNVGFHEVGEVDLIMPIQLRN